MLLFFWLPSSSERSLPVLMTAQDMVTVSLGCVIVKRLGREKIAPSMIAVQSPMDAQDTDSADRQAVCAMPVMVDQTAQESQLIALTIARAMVLALTVFAHATRDTQELTVVSLTLPIPAP